MPSRTITVILNANHAKKCAFLLRSLEAPNEAILREARNKFRVKGLSHIYLRGGLLLEPDADLGEMTWVQQVWVSKGEPYSGPPTISAQSGVSGEVRIIAEKSFVDDQAIKQLEQAAALPGVHIAVGMPDLHPGNRFPIGCVIAADGIYPAMIGSDVGCGIALYPLLPPSKTSPNPVKLASRLKGLDAPWSGSIPAWLLKYGIARHSPFDEGSLGTVGGGNHFCEITAVERIVDKTAAERLGIQEGALYLLGSRGLGASILMDQTRTESNPYIPPDSPQLPVYLAEHDYAVQWARANRDLVAHRVKECLLPTSESDQSDELQPSDLCRIVDVTHNSVTPHSLIVDNEPKNLWLHRKGAAPSTGITPCPGSRGHFSWLLEPAGDGQYNAHSLAHGAGRRHARAALHGDTKHSKSSLTTTSLGSEVICTNSDLLVEEMPEAYKDVGCVVDDMEDQGICRGIVVLRPIVTYKIREAGESRK